MAAVTKYMTVTYTSQDWSSEAQDAQVYSLCLSKDTFCKSRHIYVGILWGRG